ncbi:thiamine-phosphate kinase [Raineyella fluvialis]|uniref:Thiamine-monophosphate kinase n=1 Tax=Raineyella fluvialis TaxID=2662261 RepID=A0A5Q2FG89_9ACTN|nr:thiamine-phosphate kinase [Raineyella fluvialis]QGF24817.1 thiamine-phosphate kinase [Raineyella fluvialis]
MNPTASSGRSPWPYPGPRPGDDDPAGGGQTIADVGEFELIDLVTKGLTENDQVELGPGDDAAIVRTRDGRTLCSVDILIEGVHFRRDWSSAMDIGRKAVAVNVSDIEAMGARPIGIVMGFSAPGDLSLTWVRYFIQGVREECDRAGVSLIGGDITKARDITISVTILGDVGPEGPVLRSGARPGDLVALKGRVGWAAAGLAALSRGFRTPKAVVEAQQVPQPPYGAGLEAARAGATAMIDVSDGLLGDLGHIAQRSHVTIDVHRSALGMPEPIRAVGQATGIDPYVYLLTGGEDHALAATFPPGALPEGWTVIGTVGESSTPGSWAVTVDGRPWEGRQGYDHFH